VCALVEVTGPLKGLRVVELGQLIAGPFCGQLLGDMGADVIKIEPPASGDSPGGDPMRGWGKGEVPLWWSVIGRNKRVVSADLRVPEGQALARRLIATADILIENFRPGTLEKWGLAPDVLHAENPGLIIVRISGYGQTGPYAGRTGFGSVGEAMGGWRAIVGYPDRPPPRMGLSIGDTLTASYACMGALAALRHRDLTGEGQVVDAALYESVLQVMESVIAEHSALGVVRERSGSILPGIAPSNVYPCSDGEILIGGNGDSIFARLAEAMGQPGLAGDPRFATHAARGQHQTLLDDIIADWTRTLTMAEVEALMVAHGVPAGRLYQPPDMVADPHFAAREALIEVPHPHYGSVRMQGVFPKLSKTPGGVSRPAAAHIGADNAEVWAEIGLSAAEIDDLAGRGII
jgi:formyl-CoA transferase